MSKEIKEQAQSQGFLSMLLDFIMEKSAIMPPPDETVHNREIEEKVIKKLVARGNTAEETNMALGVLKNVGALMAGSGVTAAPLETSDYIPPSVNKSVGGHAL